MLRYYYKTAKDENFSIIDAPQEGCWIHAEEASAEELLEISRIIGIESTELQDCLDKYELPRIETLRQATLIFTRYPTDIEPSFYTSPLAIILVNHYFITISPLITPIVHSYLTYKTNLATSQKSKMLFSLLLKISQEFSIQLKKVRHNVVKLEKELIKVESDDIAQLTRYEEVLNQYDSSLISLRQMLEEITSGRHKELYEKGQKRLDDLLNTVKQLENLCMIALKSIISLRDSYQIIFTNNLHKTIKLLTALTIIFNIPTIIASIYGMNVHLPLAESGFAFIYILLFIFGLSALGILFFKQRKWL